MPIELWKALIDVFIENRVSDRLRLRLFPVFIKNLKISQHTGQQLLGESGLFVMYRKHWIYMKV